MAVLITLFGSGFCLVRAYSVEPHSAQLSGWTHGEDGYVSEILTCNFDSLTYVELFAGDSGSTGSGYRVGVWEGGVELTHADGVQHQPTSWVRFDNWNAQVAFTKGKKYEFRFTRSGGDSLQYYYDEACGYNYGEIVAPSFTSPTCGLAMRCYGRMDAVDETWVRADASVPTPAQPD